jgi:hypothetical protein
MFALFYSLKQDPAAAEPYLGRLLAAMSAQRVSPVVVAWVYASQRRLTKALDLLERAAAWKDRMLLYLKVDPFLENLHGQPRFDRLLSEMRL